MQLMTRNLIFVFLVTLVSACSMLPESASREPSVSKPAPQSPSNAEGSSERFAQVVKPDAFAVERQQIKASLSEESSMALPADESGYYTDLQEARLLQQLTASDIEIKRVGDEITLTFPGTSSFEFGSSELSQDANVLFEKAAEVLVEFDKTVVAILGHTDDSGTDEVNQRVSEQRGLSVAKKLVEEGVLPKRLLVVGFGESTPVASNETEQGQRQNRRVEIILQPITD